MVFERLILPISLNLMFQIIKRQNPPDICRDQFGTRMSENAIPCLLKTEVL